MKKIVFTASTLEFIESTFPAICKSCLEQDCTGCPFREERLELEAELLFAEEPTLEKYELLQKRNK